MTMRFKVICILLLCVADIHLKVAVADLFIPNPNIGDVAVIGIAVQVAFYISFGAAALRACGYGIVPAVNCTAVKIQSHAHGIALRKTYPVADTVGEKEFPTNPKGNTGSYKGQ